MLRVAVFVSCALCAGCSAQVGGSKVSLLMRTESRQANGAYMATEAPDVLSTGNALGAATTCITGSPWGILAGAGSTVASAVTGTADNLTTKTR